MSHNTSYSVLRTGLMTLCLVWVGLDDFQAQQLSRQSQFVQNPFLVNPAFAGTELGTFASISHREQWVGFHGAPSTSNVTVTSSLPNRFGVGFTVAVSYTHLTLPTKRIV